jgi:hypothetical protein
MVHGGAAPRGLRLGEEGEHDECKELQAWEARQQQNIPPCARTCSNPASQLLHAASEAVACAAEGKAARAGTGSVGVNLLFTPTTHNVQIASLWRLSERETRTNGVGSS